MKQLATLEQRIWQNPNPSRLGHGLRIVLAVFRIVTQSQIQLFATSLTYTTLLAVVPLLAVLFTLLKSFGIDTILKELLVDVLSPMGNAGQEVANYLTTFVSNAQSGLLGGIGLIFLFYSVFTLFRKIETSVNHIWSITDLRKLSTQLLAYLGALMLTVLVATLAIGLNVLSHQNDMINDALKQPALAFIITYAVKGLSIMITAGMLAVVYSAAINTNVRIKAAFSGGLFCAILWLPLTAGFAAMMSASSNYSLIYSSFAGLIILLIWLQILWLLFLSGSLVAYFVQYPALLKPYGTAKLNLAEQEYYAHKVIHRIIERFQAGQGTTSLNDLIASTQLSHRQIINILTPFLNEDIIMTLGKENNEYLLAKNVALVSDEVILATIRGKVRRQPNDLREMPETATPTLATE